jgi:anti-sigma28 factor (negative regulator of flagellin synthesis)
MARKPRDGEEAERRFQQAIAFTRDVRGDEQAARDIEEAGLDAWLESKGWDALENPGRTKPKTQRRTQAMTTLLRQNPATGQEEEVDVSKLSVAELRQAVEDVTADHDRADEALSEIADLILSFEDGEIDASDLADEIWDVLTEYSPEDYPADDEEEDEQAAA